MANMKQQIKRYKNDNKKRAKNASYKSALKTAIKNVRAEVEAGNKEAAEKAKKELGWEAEYGIEDMCADSWRWQKNNPNGYED